MEFFDSRLPAIQARLENWWAHGCQEHPCVIFTAGPEDPSVVPDTKDLPAWWTNVDFVIEREMKLLDSQTYHGEAVPYHYVCMGSSAMAAILGAEMEYLDKETVWPHPRLESLEQVMEVGIDRSNFFYRTLRAITERSVDLARGHHFVTLFSLGGVADTVASLYGIENLLTDMATKPEQVSRTMERIKRIWIEIFEEFQGILSKSGNRGGIGWAGVWSPGTTFPIQEDFSYMISNEMFRKFCLPHIRDMVDVMECPFYHLDGEAALVHLDSLLDIDDLRVIQWTPGAGKERLDRWYGVIRRILEAGRSVQVYGRAGEVNNLVKNVGARGILITIEGSTSEEVEALLEQRKGST